MNAWPTKIRTPAGTDEDHIHRREKEYEIAQHHEHRCPEIELLGA